VNQRLNVHYYPSACGLGIIRSSFVFLAGWPNFSSQVSDEMVPCSNAGSVDTRSVGGKKARGYVPPPDTFIPLGFAPRQRQDLSRLPLPRPLTC
jgi:hypothetical protein